MPYIAEMSATATKPDDDTHENDHCGLEQARKMLYPHLQFTVVIRRRRLELYVQRSGLFADPEHLSGRARKESRLSKWFGQPLALHHLLPNVFSPVTVHGVVGGVRRDRHRLGEVYTGPEHRREDPAYALQDGSLNEKAENRAASG